MLELEGEIVFETSNEIKDKAKKKLEEAAAKNIILDLKKVTLVDSSGIGALISLFKYTRERDGRLVITSPTEKVQKVISITKLDKIIDIYDSVEEAVETF